MAELTARVAAASDAGRTVLVGFDFSFGYPARFASLTTGPAVDDPRIPAPWLRTWVHLGSLVRDDLGGVQNANNRYEAAGIMNRNSGMALFWGRPPSVAGRWLGRGLADVPAGLRRNCLPQLRTTERLAGGRVQSGFRVSGTGSVGGQVLVGIPRLADFVARLRSRVTVWPFETGFCANPLRPSWCEPGVEKGRPAGLGEVRIVIAEVWPSLFTPGGTRERQGVVDRAQVLATAGALANMPADACAALWSPPSCAALAPGSLQAVRDEEGWILGVR